MLARFRKSLRVFMVAALALNFLTGIGPVPSEVRAQDRVIVIKAEQPNVWTLEQAHYLLAQMHRRDLDLRAKRLEDLDANEIAGLHFDIMRMLVEFGATFNQADLAANRLLSANQTFNSERRQQLLGERDSLSKESLQLEGDIDGLKAEKADTDTDDADAQKRIDAKIAAKTAQQAKVDKRIEQIDTELGTLTAPSGQLKATEGGATFEPDKLPKSAFDDAFKAAAAKQIEKFNDAPKINASLQLDNFLQLQYEIISKQLTLLRDEVGPGERLLFLELPQSVNVTHHEADKKWAQSWWKIAGYTKRVPVKNTDGTFRAATAATPIPEPSPNQKPITTSDDINSLFGRQTIKVEAELRPKQSPTPMPDPKATSDLQKTQGAASAVYEYTNTFVNLDNPVNTAQDGFDPELKAYLGEKESKVSLSNRLVRTVELIPRQGSINVNDMKLRTTAGAFNFVLSTLFGFGSRLNIERQREQFSQFVQQELYSSAFGKGSREFGWTFTPMPGTDRLMSGVRTTYAAIVVPDDATSLVLEYNGCYFPRSQYPPNDFADTKDAERWNKAGRTSRQCGGTDSRAFIVPIPSANIEGGNDFWIKTISYQPVPKGGTAVVHISGKNISPQIGALVNGVSLPQSIGLAQPLIRDDSEAGRETAEELKESPIQGHIERVDVTSIVLSFKMPADYAGTPTITLIAPGRSVDINWIPNLNINDARGTSLIEYTKKNGKMFGQQPAPDAFRIDAVRVFRSRNDPKHLTALVSGGGFTKTTLGGKSDVVANVLINGSDDGVTPDFKSPSLLTIDFPVPHDDSIKVTLVPKPGDLEPVDSEAIPNPALLTILDVKIVTFEPATKDEPATLVVKITGTGFTDKLKATIGTKTLDVAVKSATEALLTLTDPKAASVVTLTDADTGQQVQTVVTRKTKSKE